MKDDEKELRERWDRDAPKCWQIMPFYRPEGETEWETEWWVMENLKSIRTLPTREEAFRAAYEHNSKTYGIYAVFVRGAFGKNGKWKQQP